MAKILLVEDDISYSRIIKNFLEKNNFSVVAFDNFQDSVAAVKSGQHDLIITDYRLPDGNGLDILDISLQNHPQIPVILITNYSDVRVAVKAMKTGAFEYITKPINPDELLATVKEAIQAPQSLAKTDKIKGVTTDSSYIVGESDTALQLESYINVVAPTDLSVLILGETGTGKEFIAQRIHNFSNRSNAPFVAIDCGSLSNELAGSELFGHIKGSFTGALDNKTGHFEHANGGTIFLDEIGNLQYEIQIKLLRAIQERKIRKIGSNHETTIDVRIIAATNDNLHSHSADGNFREDLFHRINEFTLEAQPLRDRKQDLPHFISFFMDQVNEKLNKNVTKIDDEVNDIFLRHSWPGNLRELKNIIRRAVLLATTDTIHKGLLPMDFTENIPQNKLVSEAATYKESLVNQEKDMIVKVMQDVKFNKSKAAKILGIDRKTLYNKLAKYNLE